MENILSKINKAILDQGVTEQWIADQTRIPQSTVHRLISGKNKKLDLPKIRIIGNALGIEEVSETAPPLSPEDQNLLEIMKSMPRAKEAMEAFLALPERKQKIHLGKMLESLEELEGERKE